MRTPPRAVVVAALLVMALVLGLGWGQWIPVASMRGRELLPQRRHPLALRLRSRRQRPSPPSSALHADSRQRGTQRRRPAHDRADGSRLHPQPLRASDQSTYHLHARQHRHAPAHLHHRRARRRRRRRAGRDQDDHHPLAATARALHLLQRHAGRPGARDDRDDDDLYLRCVGDPTASRPQAMSSQNSHLCAGPGYADKHQQPRVRPLTTRGLATPDALTARTPYFAQIGEGVVSIQRADRKGSGEMRSAGASS